MLHENGRSPSVTKGAPWLAFMEPWTPAPPLFGELESGPHLSPEDLNRDLMAQAGRNLRALQKVTLLLSDARRLCAHTPSLPLTRHLTFLL